MKLKIYETVSAGWVIGDNDDEDAPMARVDFCNEFAALSYRKKLQAVTAMAVVLDGRVEVSDEYALGLTARVLAEQRDALRAQVAELREFGSGVAGDSDALWEALREPLAKHQAEAEATNHARCGCDFCAALAKVAP